MELNVPHKQVRDIIERVTAAETQDALQILIAAFRHLFNLSLRTTLVLILVAKIGPNGCSIADGISVHGCSNTILRRYISRSHAHRTARAIVSS
jgi:hypothetical protein